jgi:hypothetical protein
MSSLNKINIKELGLTDQEAIDFVKKLRSLGTSVYYMTDGTSESFILGKFGEELPITTIALKQKIETLEKEIESIKLSVQELKVIKAIEPLPQTQPQQKIELPPIPAPIPEIPKPLTENIPTTTVIETSQLGFKSRLEPQETPPTQVQMQSVSFKCPYCNHTFSENVPKGEVVRVKCPKCGMMIYKKSWWTRRKKIAVAGLVCLALFLIWLLI